MKYHTVIPARFLSRPNRFIAKVELDGREETVHVKNTGRCKELLIPGNTVYLALGENPKRKTKYDLIAVEKQPGLLINMDSQLPNAAAAQWLPKSGLFSEKAVIRREVTYGASRFDLYVEDGLRRAFLEVKGVTLEEEGLASFPDAPTERGIKHLRELSASLAEGYEAYVLFVIQMKGIHGFCPNEKTHPAFAAALREAAAAGVQVLAMDCLVTPDSMVVDQPVRVLL
ncbi:MAG: DNA/RNA nuclease SfsA [Oscillospiraceae bacterium]|nr:DNA/RNA nuclease SfsA [Oscillospiraceae bacterium]